MAGQVRGRSAAEHGVPASPKGNNIEIAQARDLDVDRFPVRHSRTDLHARHGTQDERRFDWRDPDPPPPAPAAR
jgi:hypothetical protein